MLTPNSALHASWREREARRESDLQEMRNYLADAVQVAADMHGLRLANLTVEVAALHLDLALNPD